MRAIESANPPAEKSATSAMRWLGNSRAHALEAHAIAKAHAIPLRHTSLILFWLES